MEPSAFPEFFRNSLLIIVLCMGAALVGAVTLLIAAARQIAEIEIPEDADFFETMQYLPITVPLALDLLDMAFDIFAAPIAWVILELLGLKALQLITVFEGLIPGTQLIPTLTIAWLISRGMKKKRRSQLRSALHEYQLSDSGSRYARLRSGTSHSLADEYRRKALPVPSDDIVDGEYFEEDLDEPPPHYFDEEEMW